MIAACHWSLVLLRVSSCVLRVASSALKNIQHYLLVKINEIDNNPFIDPKSQIPNPKSLLDWFRFGKPHVGLLIADALDVESEAGVFRTD